jgi:hypothetical protein
LGILANRPVIRATAAAAVQAAVAAVREQRSTGRAAPMPPVEANSTVVQATAERIAAQPALVNAMNAEPWWQSRIKIGTLILAVTMIGRWVGVELPAVSDADMDIIYNVLTTFGGGIAGIGRWVQNLRPINWRRPWTLLGIGR